jgi:hypothetical protein
MALPRTFFFYKNGAAAAIFFLKKGAAARHFFLKKWHCRAPPAPVQNAARSKETTL